MNITKRSRRLTSLGVALGLAVAIAVPTMASAATGLEATPTVSNAPNTAQYDAQLQALAGTQTEAEIHQVEWSGGQVYLLVDGATGKVTAAYKPNSRVHTDALSFSSPGCTSTSLCMTTTSSVPYGYTGTGSLSGRWGPLKRFAAGDREAYINYGGHQYSFPPDGFIVFGSHPVTITRIQRL
ncbi:MULTISPECIES: hypothetical protein [Curtobacterium]|uniref:hypothetical protein n=1 Tax=Curtobacterium TaxID=2034 RepID=UPI0012DC06C1|nr:MULTISPECIES: hypothetical protein [Curtobacterium]MDD1385452.1 hypothetical protein [Curtobacterium flaccumfaciens pv. poinsettiae]MDQ0537472.1 hypothetical protein [Curtobacterium flaccumfaciens]UXZ58014.1 hypothetical protein MXD64_01135 [Curtobacterium sp. Arg-1]